MATMFSELVGCRQWFGRSNQNALNRKCIPWSALCLDQGLKKSKPRPKVTLTGVLLDPSPHQPAATWEEVE